MLLGRIYRKVSEVFWKVVSKISKPWFESGLSKNYRYKDELFFNDKATYKKKASKIGADYKLYWNEKKQFKLSEVFLTRSIERRKMLMEVFLPLVGNSAELLDVGCGEGEWDSMIAPYCNRIDAFDYSQGMVETARENNKEYNNICFEQADAKTLAINKRYDGALMLGLLMYFDDINDINQIVANVSNHLKKGGYLYSSDTINVENRPVIYLLNKQSGYTATYCSEDVLGEMFRNAGLKLVEKRVFDDLKTRRMHFRGIGTIWQKL